MDFPRVLRLAGGAWKVRCLGSFAPELGRSLCALGRYDEAEPLAQPGRDNANDQDLDSQAGWRGVLALVQSSRGHHAEPFLA
jgi:hypothetical protein